MYGTQAQQWTKQRNRMFENDVNMYGTQAGMPGYLLRYPFENDVNMYGTQASLWRQVQRMRFENDVNLIILRYTEEVLSHFGTEPLFCYMTAKRRE